MNDEEIIEIIDSLVSLPRRDTLATIIQAKRPVSASEIADSLNISISEALDHIEVLRRSGLIATKNNSGTRNNGKKLWYFSHPMNLQVSVSESGVIFKEVQPRSSFLRRLLALIHLRSVKKA